MASTRPDFIKYAWIQDAWSDDVSKRGRFEFVCAHSKEGRLSCRDLDCGKCTSQMPPDAVNPNVNTVLRTDQQQGGSWFVTVGQMASNDIHHSTRRQSPVSDFSHPSANGADCTRGPSPASAASRQPASGADCTRDQNHAAAAGRQSVTGCSQLNAWEHDLATPISVHANPFTYLYAYETPATLVCLRLLSRTMSGRITPEIESSIPSAQQGRCTSVRRDESTTPSGTAIPRTTTPHMTHAQKVDALKYELDQSCSNGKQEILEKRTEKLNEDLTQIREEWQVIMDATGGKLMSTTQYEYYYQSGRSMHNSESVLDAIHPQPPLRYWEYDLGA